MLLESQQQRFYGDYPPIGGQACLRRAGSQAFTKGWRRRFYGDYSEGVHLFPFRTEQLSPSAPMVLQLHAGE